MSTLDRTAAFFDRYAGDFNAIYGNKNTLVNNVVNTLFRRSMKLRYMLTVEGCDPIDGRSVLDIGCGPGHYSVELARRGAGRVLGVDIAEGMLDIARGRARAEGVERACSFELGSFSERRFDERFDYVVAMGFMDYIADPRPVVEKALSLAKARAFFSFPLSGGLLAWQRQLRYRDRCDLFLYSEPEVRRIFLDVGAKHVDVRRIDRDLFVVGSKE